MFVTSHLMLNLLKQIFFFNKLTKVTLNLKYLYKSITLNFKINYYQTLINFTNISFSGDEYIPRFIIIETNLTPKFIIVVINL